MNCNFIFSICPKFRAQGYGKAFIAVLKPECQKLGINELLCTVKNQNKVSIQTVLACGGVIDRITDERHYITITL